MVVMVVVVRYLDQIFPLLVLQVEEEEQLLLAQVPLDYIMEEPEEHLLL